MAKATKVKQLSFTMDDKPGLLADITAALAGVKINITCLCAYGMEGKAYFMLVTDSNAKAKKILVKMRGTVEEGDVFAAEMPNKSGELDKVAKRIAAAGINIFYMYGTTSTGKTSICVFSTSDDKKAIKAINK